MEIHIQLIFQYTTKISGIWTFIYLESEGWVVYECPYTTNFRGISENQWYMNFHIPLILVVYGEFSHIQLILHSIYTIIQNLKI